MKKRFIVREDDYQKRATFYKYVHDNYDVKDVHFNEKGMIETIFPFVIDFNDNTFSICNSITVCACLSQANVLITTEQFKNEVLKMKK